VVEDTFEIINEWKYGRIILGNEFVNIEFLAGQPREQYVAVSIYDLQSKGGVSRNSLRVEAYASTLGVREYFFPESSTAECRARYRYFGSPHQLLASVIFLSAHCASLLNGSSTVEECRTNGSTEAARSRRFDG